MHPTRHIQQDMQCHTLPHVFGCIPTTGACNHFIDLKIYNKHSLRVLVKSNQIESNFYKISFSSDTGMCMPLNPAPAESSGAYTDTSSSLGAPSYSGVGAGELVATVASPGVAGPFTPFSTCCEVSSFCHGEDSSVCRNSSSHPTSVSISMSLEKGLDSSFSDLHLSSQLWPQRGPCPMDPESCCSFSSSFSTSVLSSTSRWVTTSSPQFPLSSSISISSS